MKIILEFDSLDPDDKSEYDRLMRANDMASLIWDFTQFIREQIKFCQREELADDILVKKFNDLCDEHKIDIYELWN